MSVGTFVTLIVLAESIVLFVAVRWLVAGLRSAECRDWPAVRPLASVTNVPGPRESGSHAEEPAVAAS